MDLKTYDTGNLPTWCPGCGDFGIWLSVKNALVKLNIGTDDAVFVYGVGCHGNMANWMKVFGIAGLHGRTLPMAQGVKLVNHKLPVFVISGDGDGLGEGGNHFLHAAKRNPDVNLILHDNQLYSLTTGQASPTAKQGFKTKSTPEGVFDEPFNPLSTAINAGATFVARGFAGDGAFLTELIIQAVKHKGFSLVDVIQPCVTFDKVHTYPWYRERIYKLDPNIYKTNNKIAAIEKSMEWGDKIPTGIFYEENRPTSEDRETALQNETLISQPIGTLDANSIVSEFI